MGFKSAQSNSKLTRCAAEHWRDGQPTVGPCQSMRYSLAPEGRRRDLAARGRSPEGRVTAKRGRILGGAEAPTRSREEAPTRSREEAPTRSREEAPTRSREGETMRIHGEESATTKTAPFRRNPSGAGGPPTYQTEAAGAPQALSGIGKDGHNEKTAPAASVSNLGAHSSLRAANPKTPARGPRDFCHGLLESERQIPTGARTWTAIAGSIRIEDYAQEDRKHEYGGNDAI